MNFARLFYRSIFIIQLSFLQSLIVQISIQLGLTIRVNQCINPETAISLRQVFIISHCYLDHCIIILKNILFITGLVFLRKMNFLRINFIFYDSSACNGRIEVSMSCLLFCYSIVNYMSTGQYEVFVYYKTCAKLSTILGLRILNLNLSIKISNQTANRAKRVTIIVLNYSSFVFAIYFSLGFAYWQTSKMFKINDMVLRRVRHFFTRPFPNTNIHNQVLMFLSVAVNAQAIDYQFIKHMLLLLQVLSLRNMVKTRILLWYLVHLVHLVLLVFFFTFHCAIAHFLLLFQQVYLKMITQSQYQLYTLNMKQINIIMQNTKRTVFITGASKGIGKGIAKVFGLNGYNLFIVSRNNIEGETCKKQLIDKGFNCQFMAADVSKLEQMKQAAKRAVQIYGGIDVLCANAGIYPQCTIQQMKQQDFDEIMNINMKGTLFSVQSCLEYLKKCPSKHPRIVITSSITGPVTGSQGWSHYGATKSAQLGFMRTASLELAKHGITVNAVLPGNIQTQGLTQLGEQYCEGMKKSIPLGRLGKPEDVGHAAVFFASVQASFVTGQSLIVDGGQILPQCKK